MTKKELKTWLINKLDSCYPVTNDDYPDCIFLYYDESLIRKMKLCKLNNTQFKIDKVTGKWIFKLDFKTNSLWCEFYDIWTFLEYNYNNDYKYIQNYIKNILKKQTIYNKLIPRCGAGYIYEQIPNISKQDKFKILTTNIYISTNYYKIN